MNQSGSRIPHSCNAASTRGAPELACLLQYSGGGVPVAERGIEQGLPDVRDPEQLVGAGLPITEVLMADAAEQRADRDLITYLIGLLGLSERRQNFRWEVGLLVGVH